MESHIDLQGASGATYRYRSSGEGDPKTAMSGNYCYVAGDGEDRRVVFLGQTDNLMTGSRARWTEACNKHGASQLFIRLNISAAARNSEMEDLLGALSPPMNEEGGKRKKKAEAAAAAQPAPTPEPEPANNDAE